MVSKNFRAIKNPIYSAKYAYNIFRRRFLVKRVINNGEVFFKYKGELYPEYLFKKKASAYIKNKALEYCKGIGLDIGAGAWPLESAKAIENIPEENAYRLDKISDASLDFVFSSHCLEHLERWQDALCLWIKKLKSGGILFLYLPHNSMVMWRPGEVMGIQHTWSPTWQVLNPFLELNDMLIVDCEKNRDRYWSFYVVAKKK